MRMPALWWALQPPGARHERSPAPRHCPVPHLLAAARRRVRRAGRPPRRQVRGQRGGIRGPVGPGRGPVPAGEFLSLRRLRQHQELRQALCLRRQVRQEGRRHERRRTLPADRDGRSLHGRCLAGPGPAGDRKVRRGRSHRGQGLGQTRQQRHRLDLRPGQAVFPARPGPGLPEECRRSPAVRAGADGDVLRPVRGRPVH